MNADELVALLRQRVKAEGGIHKFAENHHMSPGKLTSIMYCGVKPTPQIIVALGLKRVTSFEPIK